MRLKNAGSLSGFRRTDSRKATTDCSRRECVISIAAPMPLYASERSRSCVDTLVCRRNMCSASACLPSLYRCTAAAERQRSWYASSRRAVW